MLVTSDLNQLLHDVLPSRVYDVARETALEPRPRLSARFGNEVLLKREDLQPSQLQLRGAYTRSRTSRIVSARAASLRPRGESCQGVAYRKVLKLRAVIVLPQTTPQIKVTP